VPHSYVYPVHEVYFNIQGVPFKTEIKKAGRF
jgi:hypothetical protein